MSPALLVPWGKWHVSLFASRRLNANPQHRPTAPRCGRAAERLRALPTWRTAAQMDTRGTGTDLISELDLCCHKVTLH